MDAKSVSPLWYKRVITQGKVRRRVQDLRIPSSPSLDFLTSRPLDLSHNESARLAADSLLSGGLRGYQEVLTTEGEVDFLSEHEKKYFLENGKNSNMDAGPDAGDGSDTGSENLCSSYSAIPCPTVSKNSDSTEACLNSNEDGNDSSFSKESNVEVYLYTENRAAGLKDMVREFIRKAEKTLAIVTDHFTDVELLCDLLEASKKRFVSVHLLLDHLNLSIFRNMWQELKLQGKDFPKFSVHSVEGQTYCAKTGRKLSGQISETFIITDSAEALAGSFSFSCLSWMVHRSLAFSAKGSSVTYFLEEFERLSSCSIPVTGFINVSLLPPFKTSLYKNEEQPKVRPNTDMDRIGNWIEDGLNSHKTERTQTKVFSAQYLIPFRQPVMQHVCMHKFTHPTLGGVPVQDHSKNKGNVLHGEHTQTKSKFQNNLAPCAQNSLNPRITGTTRPKSTLLAHRQDKAIGSSTQNKDLNKGLYSFKCEDYWTQRQNRASITPTSIAAGINKHKRERNTSQPKSSNTDNSKVMQPFMSQVRDVKQHVQSALNGAWGATYELQTKVMSNGIKTHDQPLPHHILRPQTQTRSPTTSISTEPKESKLFSPTLTIGRRALEPKAPQQVKPPSRMAWMIQNNTMREGTVPRQNSFNSYDTVQQMDGHINRMQFHRASAKPLTRSKSMIERAETRTNLK